jgi:hypothetical protein
MNKSCNLLKYYVNYKYNPSLTSFSHSMRSMQTTIYNPTPFAGGLDAKNSSISFGGGYSQGSGWNANITYTKKW